MTEIINKKETNDSIFTESSTIHQETLFDDNEKLSDIPRYGKNLIKRRTSSIGSISNKMIKQLNKLNPSNYHNSIKTDDFANELNTFDRYNKFYEEKSNKKYKNNKISHSNYTTTTTISSTEDNTVNNWTNTINEYWLKDTNIEDIEFDDSSDEEEQK